MIIRSGGAEYLLQLGARESPHLEQLLAEMLLDRPLTRQSSKWFGLRVGVMQCTGG